MYENQYCSPYADNLQQFAVKENIKTQEIYNREQIKERGALDREINRKHLQEIFEDRKILRDLIICSDSDGNIVVAVHRVNDKETYNHKKIILARIEKKILYYTCYPQYKEVLFLELYSKGESISIVFPLDDGCLSASTLFKKFQEKRIPVNLSRRMKREIGDLLVDWLLSDAEPVEIPLRYGCNKREDGTWIVAGIGDITMEVLQNE